MPFFLDTYCARQRMRFGVPWVLLNLQCFLPELGVAGLRVQLVFAKAEFPVSAAGRVVVAEYFKRNLAAMPGARGCFDLREQALGDALAATGFDHHQVMDIDQGSSIEGGK